MSYIDAEQMEAIALGSAIYGTGGGGDPYLGKLLAQRILRESGPVSLIDVLSLSDDALVIPVAGAGAPVVLTEKLPSVEPLIVALQALEKHLGRKADATLCLEAGGYNSTIPFSIASRLGIPLIDGDTMGRAFPELQMTTCTLNNITATPMAVVDDRLNVLMIQSGGNSFAERITRSTLMEMGGSCACALYPMTGAQAKKAVIRGSIRALQRAGQVVLDARRSGADAVQSLLEALGGFRLFQGKVVGVDRRLEGGWQRGVVTLQGLDAFADSTARLDLQNEFLYASVDDQVIAMTPDLICCLDSQSGEPITSEAMRYGLRVTLMGLPSHTAWRTPAGLELAGPRHFGFDSNYISLEELAAAHTRNRSTVTV
jgi:DUF917 family protein